MAASSIVPDINPVGAGHVSITLVDSGETEHYTYEDYEIEAHRNAGYIVDHIEYTYTYEDLWDGGTIPESGSAGTSFSFREQNNTDTYYRYGNYTLTSVTAYFKRDPSYYIVTTEAKYAAGGIVTGGGTYAAGTTITLEATANPGYQFAGWKSSAGDTESSPSFSYTVTSDITWTAYFGTGRLIYFDRTGSGIDVPGDATVTVDFDPKLWTCERYGQDHPVTLTVSPSWGSTSTISVQTKFDLAQSTIAGGSTFTIGLTANTHCDAGIYPEITAIVVIQQLNVGTFTLEVPLTVGTQSTATITASNGRITALN